MSDNFYLKNGAGFIEADRELVEKAKIICDKRNYKYFCGNVYCSDNFYTEENRIDLAIKNNLLGVEMESVALYLMAKKFHKKALTICIVSDNVVTKESLSALEKEDMFDALAEVAVQLLFEN